MDDVEEGIEIITNTEQIKSWTKRDIRAQRYMMNTILPSLQENFAECDTAHEMWEKICFAHLHMASENINVTLNKYYTYKYVEGHDVTAHMNALKALVRRLKDLKEPVTDNSYMLKVVSTLPPKFEVFKAIWSNLTDEERSMKALVVRLVAEEERLKSQVQPQKEAHNDGTSDALRAGTSSSRYNNQQSSSNRQKRKSVTCSYCERPGHEENDCYKRQKEEGKKQRCSNCKRSNHRSEDCWRKKSHSESNAQSASSSKRVKKERSEDDYAFVASQGNIGDQWFCDSGATNHMCDMVQQMTNYESITDKTWTVDGIGGIQLTVAGKGDIPVFTTVDGVTHSGILYNVLHVPGIQTNLFSIASVTKRGMSVTFIDDLVQITRNGKVMMEGRRNGRKLYQLNIKTQIKSSALTAITTRASLITWHQRLSHASYRTVIRMSADNLVHGIIISGDIKEPCGVCSGCAFGKMARLPFKSSTTNTTHVGELIHTDVVGPMQKPSPTGSIYYVLFIDDFSGMRAIYFMKSKSDVFENLKLFSCKLRSETKESIKTLRSDGGGEFMSKEMAIWMTEAGIRHETSAAHTPQQNGVSERGHRTICESGRSILHMKSLPLYLWAEALSCSTYTRNRTPSCKSSVTPYEIWHKKKPDISNLRIFGSEAFVHIPDANRKKLEAKSIKCIFVGYSPTQKAYRFWNPESRSIMTSRDAIINENTGEIEHTDDITDPVEASTSDDITDPVGASTSTASEATQQPSSESLITAVPPRRSLREKQPKKQWQDWAALSTTSSPPSEPGSYNEALASQEVSEWQQSMTEEYNSLIENGTWTLVDLPPGQSVVTSRWTYKNKIGLDGEISRRRSRFVARGFTQRYGLDYDETYAPVVKYDSLRAILSIAAEKDLEMLQVDVKTAFLYGDIDEEIYVQQPQGFVVAGQENKVCHLHKGLYGLKQSPRIWNQKLNDTLTTFGFKSCSADPCVYIRDINEEYTILGIWVDDGIVCSNSVSVNKEIVSYLSSHFQITSGPADRFVGLHINRDRNKRHIFVSQPLYIQGMLHRFGMATCNPKLTPADPYSQLTKLMSPKDEKGKATMFDIPYRELVGSLSHAANCTRPDISYAVNQAAQFNNNPGRGHWEAAKRILSYLKGTANYGLLLGSGSGFKGFSDSDYARDKDLRRSVTGIVFHLFGGPIAWSSHKQSCVALSTCEAEYVAACDATREAVWLRQLLHQLGFLPVGPTRLLCDSQSAIRLARNPDQHKRTKHIDVRYHFVREQQAAKNINLVFIGTKEQVADILTKPLDSIRFIYLRERLGVVEDPSSIISIV